MLHNSTELELPWNQTLDRQYSDNRAKQPTDYSDVNQPEVPSGVVVLKNTEAGRSQMGQLALKPNQKIR